MSGVDSDDLPEPQGPLDRLFRHVVTGVVVAMILLVPLATWIGKRFFGWQPPPIIDKVLGFFNT